MRVKVGRYEVIFDADRDPWGNNPIDNSPRFYATRDGYSWRDLTGDQLVFSLAFELDEARQRIVKLGGTL